MITTEESIAMAREVGCLVQEDDPSNEYGITLYEFHAKTLTALCNLVRKQTLMGATDILFLDQDKHENPCTALGNT